MTQQRKDPADLIGDFQRWLVRSGARGMSRGLSGQIKGTLGRRSPDVWEHATAQSAGEPPECPWCPHCRARRMLRESGPGLTSHMAAAGGTVASVISEAASVLEAALANTAQPPQPPSREKEPADGGADGQHQDNADTGPAEGLLHEPPAEGLLHEPPAEGLPHEPPAEGLPHEPPAEGLPHEPPAEGLPHEPDDRG